MRVQLQSNAAIVVKGLAGIETRMRSVAPATKVGAAIIDKLIDDSFRSQKSPGGERWAPLSESTIKQRRKKLTGSSKAPKPRRKRKTTTQKVTEKRGKRAKELSSSNRSRPNPKRGKRKKKRKPAARAEKIKILQDTGVLRGGWNARGFPDSIVFGTNVPYAGVHQRGNSTTPARHMAPVSFMGGNNWRFIITGRAAKAFKKIRRTLVRYVKTGKV